MNMNIYEYDQCNFETFLWREQGLFCNLVSVFSTWCRGLRCINYSNSAFQGYGSSCITCILQYYILLFWLKDTFPFLLPQEEGKVIDYNIYRSRHDNKICQFIQNGSWTFCLIYWVIINNKDFILKMNKMNE